MDSTTMRQHWNTYAMGYQLLLGDDWTVKADGCTVTNGTVTIDARTGSITWFDLAPDDETRQRRTLRMPSGSSIGASVDVAKALADISAR